MKSAEPLRILSEGYAGAVEAKTEILLAGSRTILSRLLQIEYTDLT